MTWTSHINVMWDVDVSKSIYAHWCFSVFCGCNSAYKVTGFFYTKNISYCKTKSKFTNSTSRQGEVIGLNHFKPLNPSWRLWGKQIPSTTQLWVSNGRVHHTECPVKPLTSTHHQLFKKQKQREPLQCTNTTATAVEIWTANWHGLKWTATIKKPVVFCWDVLT